MNDEQFIADQARRSVFTVETVREALIAARGNRALCRRALSCGQFATVHPARLITWIGSAHLRDFGLKDSDLELSPNPKTK